MPDEWAGGTGGIVEPVYFSLKELGQIVLLALLVVVTGIFVPQYLLSGEAAPGFVNGVLNLPGPGAGIPIFGASACFFLVLGMVVVKKPWTAIITSVFIIAFTLLVAGPVSIDLLDVYLFIAIIIEIAALLPVGEKPWKYLMPVILVILAVVVLAQMVTGQVWAGENSANATLFPAGYAVTAGLALCCAVACSYYPLKCLIGGGIANACFLLHFFLFRGREGFASAVPALQDLPVLILVALIGGVLAAATAYSMDMMVRYYRGERPAVKR